MYGFCQKDLQKDHRAWLSAISDGRTLKVTFSEHYDIDDYEHLVAWMIIK